MQTGKAEFNFIATTYKGLEGESKAECVGVLRGLGDATPSIWNTGVSGLLIGRTSLDVFDVVAKLKSMVAEDPWCIRLLLRFIPIEAVTAAKPDAVKEAVSERLSRVGKEESFRVTVEKRHNETPSAQFIEAAASALHQKVDLETPDWVVLIEVVGEMAGVSLLRPNSIFSYPKAKRGEP